MKNFEHLPINKTYAFFKYFFLSAVIVILLGNILLKVDKIFAFTIENPSILNLKTIENNGFTNQFYISGLSEKGTNVSIYIDGTYKNKAQIKESGNEKFNIFEYYSQDPLEKGKHEIKVISKNDVLSVVSAPISRAITVYKKIETVKDFENLQENTVLSPEIAKPTNNQNFERNWIIVSGLTNTKTKVNIYLNGKYITSTDFLDDSSGTANFNYTLTDLKYNENQVFVTAENRDGIISAKSETITFNIKEAPIVEIIPTTDDTLTEETTPTVTENTTKEDPTEKSPSIEIKLPKNNDIVANKLEVISKIEDAEQVELFIDNVSVYKAESGISDFEYIYENELQEGEHTLYFELKNKTKTKKSDHINFIIAKSIDANTGTSTEQANTTNTDEGTTTTNDEQDDNSVNVGIFILFLAGIITWLILINKEMIKEKVGNKNEEKKIDEDMDSEEEKTENEEDVKEEKKTEK